MQQQDLTNLVIDGALGTALEQLGANLNSRLWTAAVLLHQPELIKQVHAGYLAAGARLLITASYQANPQALMAAGCTPAQAAATITNSVTLAKTARAEFKAAHPTATDAFVAGAVGPYGAYLADGSEYRGDYQLSPAQLQDFHREKIAALVAGKPDCLLLETQPQLTEVRALLELINAEFNQLPVIVSFCLKDDATLCDGTPLKTAAATVSQFANIIGIGVNCIAPAWVTPAIKTLRAASALPVIAYPNSGAKYDPTTKTWDYSAQPDFKHLTQEWHAAGAAAIGGCCTTTAREIKQIAEVLTEGAHD